MKPTIFEYINYTKTLFEYHFVMDDHGINGSTEGVTYHTVSMEKAALGRQGSAGWSS